MAYEAMRWWSPPELQHFSGELTDLSVEDFSLEAERVLAAYPMREEMAAYYIFSHLKGVARREVMLHTIEDTNTPEKIINILRAVFGDRRRITTLLSAFYGRDQLPEESVLDYSHVLRGLERIIHMREADALADYLLRDRFIEGLFNPELRKELRHWVGRKPLATFFQARDEALRWLSEEKEQEENVTGESELTLTLRQQIVVLENKVKSLQELVLSVTALVGNVSTGKRKCRKRRKRNKNKPVKVKVPVLRDSNPQNTGLKGFRPLTDSITDSVSLDKMHKDPLLASTSMEDESQEGEWVLLPIPPKPGISGSSSSRKGSGQAEKLSIAVTERSLRSLTELASTCSDGGMSHPERQRPRLPGPDVGLSHKVLDRGKWFRKESSLYRERSMANRNPHIPVRVAACA